MNFLYLNFYEIKDQQYKENISKENFWYWNIIQLFNKKCEQIQRYFSKKVLVAYL